jgi:hypothetical protein
MLGARRSLECTEKPAFEKRYHAVDSWQQFVCLFAAISQHMNSVNETPLSDAIVACPSVRDDSSTSFDGKVDERAKTGPRRVGNDPHADPADGTTSHLGGHRNEHLDDGSPTFDPDFYATHVGLVYLNLTRQAVAAWSNHASSQLVKPCPCCLIASETENPLEAECVRTVLLTHQPPYRFEPKEKGQLRSMEDGPCRYRHLVVATLAVHETAALLPGFWMAASGASIPERPAEVEHVASARFVAIKAAIELYEVGRVVDGGLRMSRCRHDHNI